MSQRCIALALTSTLLVYDAAKAENPNFLGVLLQSASHVLQKVPWLTEAPSFVVQMFEACNDGNQFEHGSRRCSHELISHVQPLVCTPAKKGHLPLRERLQCFCQPTSLICNAATFCRCRETTSGWFIGHRHLQSRLCTQTSRDRLYAAFTRCSG